MKDINKISGLNEKSLIQLRAVNRSIELTDNQFRQDFQIEDLNSIEKRIMGINKEDAKKSVAEYEKLVHMLKAEDVFSGKISADIHKSIGLNYTRLEQWQNALDILSEYIEHEPEDTESLFLIGLCHLKLINPKKAAEYFESIVRIDTHNPVAYCYWGVALKHLYNNSKDVGCLRKAIEKYKRAAEIKPDYYDAIHNQATALEDLHIETNELAYLNQSIEKYDEAIKLEPGFAQPHFNLCSALVFLFHAGQEPAVLDDALMHGYRSLELDPEDKNIYYNIACVYSLKEMKIEMIEALDKAIDFDSKHREIAGKDRDFAKYHDDPDFVALIKDNEEDRGADR